MTNQTNNNDQQSAVKGVANRIKQGAGTVFGAVDNTLEATENVAMNAVDQTANAIDQTVDSVTNTMGNQANNQQKNQ